MTHHTDPRQIEQDIEHDRAQLASTLDALQDRVSIDTLAQDALGMLRANSAGYTQSIDRAVRANPMALALVGVGLAWLVFGNRGPAAAPHAKLEALSNWEDDGGPARPSDERVPGWSDHSDSLRQRASATLRRLETEGHDMAQGARDFVKERAAVLTEFTDGLKQSFLHGLEGLSDAARDRIVAAREAAYSARLQAERFAKGSPANTGRMLEDHPMITGAVVLALGAALGAALPRTKIEARVFGAESERLMKKAARALDSERASIAKAANGIATDLGDTARSKLHAVTETVMDKVTAAADKVSSQIAQVSEKV